ncbi:MAG: hypothetical protein ACO1OB_01055, partial [Archangium sp.]
SQVSTPCVITKRSLSRGVAVSLPEVEAAFRRCLTTTPPALRAMPAADTLRLRFQTRAEALAADSNTIPVMASFHAQFLAACERIDRTAGALAARIAGTPVNAARLLLDPWDDLS